MKKRFVLHILAACMLLTLLAPRGFATETDPPVESCGDGLSWSLDGSTLTVSGSGAMKDFEGGAPWSGSADQIHTVVLTGGVTSVGGGGIHGLQKPDGGGFRQFPEGDRRKRLSGLRGTDEDIPPGILPPVRRKLF